MLLSCHHYSAASGWSTDLDHHLDSCDTLVIVFGPPDLKCVAAGLDELQRSFPQSHWTGCSTSGEIFGRAVTDDSLSVAIVRFERSRLKMTADRIDDPKESFRVGEQIVQALSEPDLKAILVLSDGLAVNGSELVKGMSAGVSSDVIITGGLAGDGDRFAQTWVIAEQVPKDKHVVAVGFYGDHAHIGCQSGGGWDVLGPEREVTHSKGNILYALDGQPALALYKKYLGDRAEGLPATGLLFPLGVRNSQDPNDLTVRTILAVSETDNSITFAGDIQQGARVRLMRANFDRLLDGASDAARDLQASEPHTEGALLAIAISCVGRRLVLGQRTEEIEAVLDELPQHTKLVGFYSYGEISTLTNGRCDLLNQTMTLTVIWEK